MNIPPFPVENPGPTNILNENQTELNFSSTSFHEVLVGETNLYTQQKVVVKPDRNESAIFLLTFMFLVFVKKDLMMDLEAPEL